MHYGDSLFIKKEDVYVPYAKLSTYLEVEEAPPKENEGEKKEEESEKKEEKAVEDTPLDPAVQKELDFLLTRFSTPNDDEKGYSDIEQVLQIYE